MRSPSPPRRVDPPTGEEAQSIEDLRHLLQTNPLDATVKGFLTLGPGPADAEGAFGRSLSELPTGFRRTDEIVFRWTTTLCREVSA